MSQLTKLRKKLDKYIVVFCVREGNYYHFIKQVSIKPNIKEIAYEKKKDLFTVDIENPTYRKGNTRYYCIDINSQQIRFEQLKEKQFVSSRLTKLIMTDTIIEQLARASAIEPKHKYDYGTLIIGLIIGVLIGVIIGFAIGFMTIGGI